MTRKFHDLLVHNEECVEFGEKELGYFKVHGKDVNYVEKGYKTDKNKINILEAGDLKRNKKIIRTNNADVLLNPVEPDERPFDTSIAEIARENDVAVAITLKKLLEYRGTDKIKYFRSLQYLGKILRRRKCPLIITSRAKEKLEMRKPMDLASIAHIAGYSKEEALETISNNVEKINTIKNDRK